MTKKILIIAAIFFLIALGVGGYFLFRAPASEPVARRTPSGDYKPFGDGSDRAPDAKVPGTIGTTTDISIKIFDGRPASSLIRITSQPVAGAGFVQGTSSLAVRYIERGTGHINDASLTDGKVRRISNTTIPKVYEALFANNGSSIVIRYLHDDLQTISTYAGTVRATSTGIGTVTGVFLPDNIGSIALSPDNKKLFYLINADNGGRGYVSDLTGARRTLVWSAPVGEWNVAWPSAASILLVTKPSNKALGYAYSLNASSGLTTRIVGKVNGLVASANPLMEKAIYSNSFATTKLLDVKKGTATTLPISTIADKCAWSSRSKGIAFCAVPNPMPRGVLPDEWYTGTVSFNDAIYRVDAMLGTAVKAFDPQTQKELIDATNLVVSPDDKYLLFTNKKDLSLWALQLEQPSAATTTASSTRNR